MNKIYQWINDPFLITTDEKSIDYTAVHEYLNRSLWANGIDLETVKESIENSLCFSILLQGKQIGFARVVTDKVTFGYLCDVYILEPWQNQGLGRWLIKCILSHPLILKLRRVMLVTSSAPLFYEKAGFSPINRENFVWQINNPNIYQIKDKT
ncbi:GNAT family N-acetyltransferase [Thorsellia kenyensis]|uniref:GNAT family N-acetyltransferase n=1 Tax=Thorsellia kenyensis TaxID=1549888 RepID=A0ABV6CDU6_9GAMM